MSIQADLDNRFDYHPADPDTALLHQGVRQECKRLAEHLEVLVPPGRELSVALTNLEQVLFWANAGIARA